MNSVSVDTIRKSRWRIWLAFILICITGLQTPVAWAVSSAFNSLYTTEFLLDYDPGQSAWIIDRFGDAAGNLELRFGQASNRSIKFDISNNWFEFGSNVNLGQNELKNVAIDNRAIAPVSPVKGQIYHNTTDKQTYLWDGIQWSNLTATGHTQNTDTGTTSNTFTLDQDNSGGNTSLIFGNTGGEALRWDIANDRFVFNDHLRVEGNLGTVGQSFIANNHTAASSDGIINLGKSGNNWQKISFNSVSNSFETSSNLNVGGNLGMNGNTFTLDADNTGAGQNVSLIANQGTGNNGVLRYNATLQRWEISNNGSSFVAVAGPGPTGPQGATGAQGPAGAQGAAGTNGFTTLFSQTAATTTACPAGGFVFNSGLDSNRNSVLDSGEIATTATICNGTNGSGSGGNGNTNGGGGSTLAGTCTVTRTASYSNSAQYSVALSGMASYTDNNLEAVLQNGVHVTSIGNNNGGASTWSNPNYVLSILGSAQNFMLYLNYNGTPPAGQTPYITTAKITKFGNTLNCGVVNL